MPISQELAERISRRLLEHPEVLRGPFSIERILGVARETLGRFSNQMKVVQTTEVASSSGAPKIVVLQLFYGEVTEDMLITSFRIDMSRKNRYPIECDNNIPKATIEQRIALGMERIDTQVGKFFELMQAESLLAFQNDMQQEMGREVNIDAARAFGPPETLHNLNTGMKVDQAFRDDQPVEINYSEFSGVKLDNLTTGIVHIWRKEFGGAFVTAREANVLTQFGWAILSDVKSMRSHFLAKTSSIKIPVFY